MRNQRATAVFYLILAGIGLATAWYFNTAAIIGQENLLTAWFTTNADLVLAFDLFVTAFAVAPFVLIEGKRLKMKNRWLYIALSAVTAVAFTF
ncbi:MAG: hypothetical protein RLZZ345_929, partial [Actinomycetota bacterium]